MEALRLEGQPEISLLEIARTRARESSLRGNDAIAVALAESSRQGRVFDSAF